LLTFKDLNKNLNEKRGHRKEKETLKKHRLLLARRFLQRCYRCLFVVKISLPGDGSCQKCLPALPSKTAEAHLRDTGALKEYLKEGNEVIVQERAVFEKFAARRGSSNLPFLGRFFFSENPEATTTYLLILNLM